MKMAKMQLLNRLRSNISPLIAEQIPDNKKRIVRSKNGVRQILDPIITIQRVYMYFYLMVFIRSFWRMMALTGCADQSGLSCWPDLNGVRRTRRWILALLHHADHTLLYLPYGHVSLQKQLCKKATYRQCCVKVASAMGASIKGPLVYQPSKNGYEYALHGFLGEREA